MKISSFYICLISAVLSTHVTIKNSSSKLTTRSLDFNSFVDLTFATFKNNFNYQPITDYDIIEDVLQQVWNLVDNNDINALALFVSSSLHNTSYYKKFESEERKVYRSRGIVSIQGEDNYEELTRLSKNNTDYVRNPEKLALKCKDAYQVSIKFLKNALQNDYTFENMLNRLYIGDFNKLKKTRPDIVNWNNMYVKLLDAYNNFGN